ncbi:MAG: DUF1826 domain-containing protein [Methylophaga sp.]
MMATVAESVQQSFVRVSDNPLVLSDIYQPEVNFTIWQREQSEGLQRDIQSLLMRHQRFSFRVILRPEDVVEWLSAKWPGGHFETFLADVQELAIMFADLFDQTHVGMRLELVDKTLCPLFHEDKVMVRMVTTYAGDATEWLTEDNVNRQALKQRDHEHVMYDHSRLQSAHTGDVLLFKGKVWSGKQGQGVVHRSARATIENRRLLLTLDVV